jgi:NhaP-type Na+/H+ or K+/H+ antiporter
MQPEKQDQTRHKSVRKSQIGQYVLAAFLILFGVLVSMADFLWSSHFLDCALAILGLLVLAGISVYLIVKWKKRRRTPDQFGRWKDIRAKGQWHYVIWRGVIGWGVPFGVFFILVRVVLPWFSQSPEYQQGDLVAKIAIAAVLCLIGGLGFGILTWSLIEREYQKYFPQHKETGEDGA